MTRADAQGEPSLHGGRGVDAAPDYAAVPNHDGTRPAARVESQRKPLDFRLFVLVFTVLAALLGTASTRRSDATTAALASAALLQIEVAEVRLTGPARDEDARSFALDETRQRDLETPSNALLSDRLPDDTDSPTLEFEVIDVDIDETLQDVLAHAFPGAATLLAVTWEEPPTSRWEIEVRGDTSRFSIETGLPRGPPSMS